MRLILSLCIIFLVATASLAQSKSSSEQSEPNYYAFAFAYGKDKTLMITEIQKVDLSVKPGESRRIAEYSFWSSNKSRFVTFLKINYSENFNTTFDYARGKTFEVSEDLDALTALFDKRVEKSGKEHLIIDGFSFVNLGASAAQRPQEMHE